MLFLIIDIHYSAGTFFYEVATSHIVCRHCGFCTMSSVVILHSICYDYTAVCHLVDNFLVHNSWSGLAAVSYFLNSMEKYGSWSNHAAGLYLSCFCRGVSGQRNLSLR